MNKILNFLRSQSLAFPLIMWVSSRSVIIIAMLGIATLLKAPEGGVQAEFGWGVFTGWDSKFYLDIASSGYGYDYIKKMPELTVAFFPLFPLAIRALASLGIPLEIAATLINNLAFLGALIFLYNWVETTHNTKVARYATAVLAWCPLSLFGTVVYTEGVFLFFSTAALASFDKKQYFWASLWGMLATATRITGLALIPTFLITAWQRREKVTAYLASLASGIGILLYSLYCQINFQDPIAFITIQHTAWARKTGFDWLGWWKMLMQISIGNTNWKYGGIKDPWYPIIFLLICFIGYCLWRFADKLGSARFDYSLMSLLFLLWILAGDPLLNTAMVLGGGYLIWHLRRELSLVAVLYGFFALGLLLASGGTISLNRLAYGIVSLSLALGVLLSRHPRWTYGIMGFFVILLVSFAIRFAQHQWVA